MSLVVLTERHMCGWELAQARRQALRVLQGSVVFGLGFPQPPGGSTRKQQDKLQLGLGTLLYFTFYSQGVWVRGMLFTHNWAGKRPREPPKHAALVQNEP